MIGFIRNFLTNLGVGCKIGLVSLVVRCRLSVVRNLQGVCNPRVTVPCDCSSIFSKNIVWTDLQVCPDK